MDMGSRTEVLGYQPIYKAGKQSKLWEFQKNSKSLDSGNPNSLSFTLTCENVLLDGAESSLSNWMIY